MQRTHTPAIALGLLLATLCTGCTTSFRTLMGGEGGAPVSAGEGGRAEELVACIGKTPPGNTAIALDPQSQAQVEVRVESEYLSGTGEICRRASLGNPGANAVRNATACKGPSGWALAPEILSAPVAGRR